MSHRQVTDEQFVSDWFPSEGIICIVDESSLMN